MKGLTFYFLENRAEKQTLPDTGWILASVLPWVPGLHSRSQEEKGAPAALEKPSWPPIRPCTCLCSAVHKGFGNTGVEKGLKVINNA